MNATVETSSSLLDCHFEIWPDRVYALFKIDKKTGFILTMLKRLHGVVKHLTIAEAIPAAPVGIEVCTWWACV